MARPFKRGVADGEPHHALMQHAADQRTQGLVLGIRSAVLRPLCGMGSDALLGARDTALEIALGTLQTVTQHVKAGPVAAVARGIGHGCLSIGLVRQYARSGSWGRLSSESSRIGCRALDIRGHTRATR